MELSGFVGGNNDEGRCPHNDIRFLYYREFERWISRFMGAHTSDIDVVKRGPLHQSAAIPKFNIELPFQASLMSFTYQSISRIFSFAGFSIFEFKESQALWSALCALC